MLPSPETRFSFLSHTAASFIAGSLLLLAIAANAGAEPVIAGFRDLFFGSDVLQKPTGSKPESKLWWNDGHWWGSLWNGATGRYEIYQLDLDTQTWSSTGVAIDNRGDSLADALWDGSKLYVDGALLIGLDRQPKAVPIVQRRIGENPFDHLKRQLQPGDFFVMLVVRICRFLAANAGHLDGARFRCIPFRLLR